MNVEVYQGQINKKYGTKFNIPVTYYSQLMTVAYGGTAKGEAEAGNGPVDRCPAGRVRHGWRAPGFDARHPWRAPFGRPSPSKFTPGELVKRSGIAQRQKAGLDGNIVRATQLEAIAAKK